MRQLPTIPVVSRLAPTPSGFLHLGNAVNFTLTWLLTRQAGGTLHLRIDDLDRARFRPAYLENIFRTLEWLGLDYDHGPTGPNDFERNFSQQHRLPEYEAALQAAQLTHPRVFYACGCSRTGLARQGVLAGSYPGTCRHAALPLSAPGVAWRAYVPSGSIVPIQDMAQGLMQVDLTAELGDFVVRKKDGVAAYQVASVLDDVRLGVTCVVRGLDLLPSTAAQLWLASQLPGQAGFRQVQFYHHALLTTSSGEKLSKSTQAGSQRGIVEEADSPQVVYEAVAQLLGLSEQAATSLAILRERIAQQNNGDTWANSV
ncbi:glutamate--tRNA ligase family protein [Hymenobacter sp. UYP22]|uniref:glutamate--tRNA ligase family protein n=1 Tax=Hymenobacter sp. UYP22 TaxID=3156348 RepID=UPI003396550E